MGVCIDFETPLSEATVYFLTARRPVSPSCDRSLLLTCIGSIGSNEAGIAAAVAAAGSLMPFLLELREGIWAVTILGDNIVD